jgi:hypothetical protein
MRRYAPGLLLIVLGVGFFFDRLGIWKLNPTIWRWWPVSIILLGLAYLLFAWSSRLAAILMTLIGTFLLARQLSLLPQVVVPIFWPLMMILFGLWVVGHKK